MDIISIVPGLPPAIDGVGDYALRLSQQMREDTGIQTHFVVTDPDWPQAEEIDGFKIIRLEKRSATELFKTLCDLQHEKHNIVTLHLSGYGYAKWSLYGWLANGLELWKQQVPNAFLLTMFHELYNTTSWPWTHRFWTSAQQKHLAGRIARLSDRHLTNCEIHGKQLSQFEKNSHRPIPILPVFSNIAEPTHVLPLAQRKKQIVVFGQPPSRLRVYKRSLQVICDFCTRAKISEIIDLGSPIDFDFRKFPIPVKQMGHQSKEKISQILNQSIAGWFSYNNNDYIGKSSILASYCSHGLVPIIDNVRFPFSFASSHKFQKHSFYLSSDLLLEKSLNISLDNLQIIATDAHTWYQSHSLKNHSNEFIKLIQAATLTVEESPCSASSVS